MHSLIASPLATGLFHRAIVESGGSSLGRGGIPTAARLLADAEQLVADGVDRAEPAGHVGELYAVLGLGDGAPGERHEADLSDVVLLLGLRQLSEEVCCFAGARGADDFYYLGHDVVFVSSLM